jgi:phospholipase/carboxylesterase
MTAPPGLGFAHRFVPATQPARKPLLLLHGTGGDENDLVPLGERLAPGAALLSPRGQVLENGMPRFFRRLAEGVFDLDDLRQRTEQLAQFIDAARAAYRIEKPVAVGFSNGANIAASLLLMRPESLAGAVLMRATTPFVPENLPRLAGVPVLILSGAMDPLVSAEQCDRLAQLLESADADVEYQVIPAGHNLAAQDLALAAAWLKRHG